MSTRTMRAISQNTLGGPEVLKEVELPVPKPGPSQILVRVRAARAHELGETSRTAGKLVLTMD